MNVRAFDKAWNLIFNSDTPDVIEIRFGGIIYSIYPCRDEPKRLHINAEPQGVFACDIDESAGMKDAMPH